MRLAVVAALLAAVAVITVGCKPSDDPSDSMATVTAGSLPTLTPSLGPKPLSVDFADPKYSCRQECWRADGGGDQVAWGYRAFGITMEVLNLSDDLTLSGGRGVHAGWRPTRWTITDGTSERVSSYAWVDASPDGDEFWNTFGPPDLPPHHRFDWTWFAFPLHDGEWVSAVEYVDEWGNLYSRDLPKPRTLDGQFNYVDCGEPRKGEC